MTGATGNIYVGLHEFADMAFLLHFLRPSDIFLDVGANVGSYTVLASAVVGAKSVSIEPDPDTVCALKRNIDANEISEKVTVRAVAVGAEEGELSFTIGLDTMNRAAHAGDAAVRIVKQVRLDTLTADAPALIKLDVEGHEEQVFRGASATVTQPELKALLIETVTDEMLRALDRAGFERAYYDPFTRALGSQPPSVAAINSLFVRDKPFVAERLQKADPFHVLDQAV